VDAHGVLSVVSQKSRSQWKNKQDAIEKFVRLIQLALRIQKKRVKTSPTLVSKEKRIQEKKRTGEKKKMRKVDLPNE
jgi:ribosome-associated protein